MFFEDWKPIYEKIADDLNFPLEKEKQAATLLNELLEEKKRYPIKKLEELIAGKEVIVFGAGPSLESSFIIHKEKFDDTVKIAADGVTSALLKNGILPDIIVTDLDGKVSDQLKANSEGSIVIAHTHGDNIDNIKKYIPEFKGEMVGSTQIDPKPYGHIQNFGGFTDGDRAVFLADHFRAKRIYLIGFDFEGEIGKYSFSENKDYKLKLKKLNWCKYLVELLKKDNRNIQEL